MLVELSAVHARDEAVGAWRVDLRRAVLNVVEPQQQLVGVLLGPAGELATANARLVRHWCQPIGLEGRS